jgi:hypothetical protein
VVDKESEAFFIAKNEKDIDLLREATNMHKVLAKILWDAKLCEYNCSSYSDTNFDSNQWNN